MERKYNQFFGLFRNFLRRTIIKSNSERVELEISEFCKLEVVEESQNYDLQAFGASPVTFGGAMT